MGSIAKVAQKSIVVHENNVYHHPAFMVGGRNLPPPVSHRTLSMVRQRARDQGASVRTNRGEHIRIDWLEAHLTSIVKECTDREREGTGAPLYLAKKRVKELEALCHRQKMAIMCLMESD